jgi:unsaturated rhamnogalacturonyl hydrolase
MRRAAIRIVVAGVAAGLVGMPARVRAGEAAGTTSAPVCAGDAVPVEQVGAKAFTNAAILALMRKVNAYTRAHPYAADDRNWIRATYYTGVMGLYRATRDAEVLAQARAWAEKHDWAEGGQDEPVNKLTVGQTYLELYFLDPQAARIGRIRAYADALIARDEPIAKAWYYCDTLYVGPPTLAMLSEATGDAKYVRYMHRAYWDTYDRLFDKKHGLFYRDKRYIGKQTRNGRPIFWSRGNGWVIGGLPRILEHLPKDDPHRARYVALLRTMAAAIAKQQGADGLWRPNLGDAEDVATAETSGTAFFTYAMAWGLNQGILPKDVYLPVVAKAWRGLVAATSEEGKLGWVQAVGAAPAPVNPEYTHEYAVGLMLLAGEELAKLNPALRACAEERFGAVGQRRKVGKDETIPVRP